MMNKRKKLKEYIKNVIRQELNEQPKFNINTTLEPPRLKFKSNYDVKADIKSKPLGLDAKSLFNKPKTYKDDWTGNLQKFGDEVQNTKTYK